ncbi:hypothetical protein [Burkholderia ambifaria]|uniref:hypothetical protein n=1 Tax=Burkholderia ambifaria TaxID=152480 RepID=UPI0013DF6F0E|nr:hypothetical protein [Burkholderia ambifaria]
MTVERARAYTPHCRDHFVDRALHVAAPVAQQRDIGRIGLIQAPPAIARIGIAAAGETWEEVERDCRWPTRPSSAGRPAVTPRVQ